MEEARFSSEVLISERLLQEAGLRVAMKFHQPSPSLRDAITLISQFAISCGATRVLLGSRWTSDQSYFSYKDSIPREVSQLHPDIQKRIILVDEKLECALQCAAIMQPIDDEFAHLEQRQPGFMQGEEYLALRRFPTFLYNLLIGVKHHCEIVASPLSMRLAIGAMRKHLRSPQASAHVAILANVFASYRPLTLDSLVIRPSAAEEAVRLFREFAEDEEYQLASRCRYGLGFPKKAKRMCSLFVRHVRKLFERPAVKGAFDLSAQGLELAGEVPVPSSEQWAQLVGKEYLPPINDEYQVRTRFRAVLDEYPS